jgi:2-dehydro-3-deoxy-L-rhamnonate dehydrogenase (NAD+)
MSGVPTTFSRRTIIVTGGAASLGLAICRDLARRGANVVVADRDGAAADNVARDIAADGGSALAIATDVTDSSALDRMVSATIERFGSIDGLVNNAGILGPIKPMWETTDEEVDRIYGLNVRAVYAATRKVVPHMMRRKRGAIVTIASVAGKDGPKDLSIYASSKAAVIGFTKSWAKELAPHGIRVNCISPSIIEATGMRGEMPDWFSKDSVSRIPMGRAATAQEVASVIAFLLSDEASFVVGTCYDVSGGRASY